MLKFFVMVNHKPVLDNFKSSIEASIWKPLLVVILLFLIAVAFKIGLVVSQGILPKQGEKIINGAFILFTTLGMVFFIRWFIVDAPFSLLRRFTIIPLLKTLISLILYFITAIYLLHRLAGIDLTPLLTTSAVFTGIIALSLQETLKNLFTGIWINTERVVAKGDWVNIAGKEGRVMDVTWRTTRLLTFSNDYIYLPNKLLSEGHVDNYTYPSPHHVVEIDVGTSYKDPPNKVKDVLLQMASENPYVLKDPMPEVYLITFGDFSIQQRLRVWINDYGALLKVRSDLHYSIWYTFKRNNIEIPFPIKTVYQYQLHAKGVASDSVEVYLRRIDFLKPLADEDIKKISVMARLEMYGENESIFKEGDKGDTCYFIKEGAVDILFKDELGRDGVVATLGPGDFFGEMSLLTGEERRATAVAKKDSYLIIIDSRGFHGVFKKNPDLMEELIRRSENEGCFRSRNA
ncbi:MAG: mechanosensitive ion channel [Deltaproteobacteria bacterium]|nr:mechanosensitive ion channel [Deltaproteobacteria bacterium]